MMSNNTHPPKNGHGQRSAGHDDHLFEIAERIATHEFGALDPDEIATVDVHALESLDRHGAIQDAVRTILQQVGEDPTRDGLLRTPYRVAKMYDELLAGYHQDVQTILNGALFDVDYGDGEMVMVAHIDYNSLCEHHMLPFTGQVHVAYLPRKKVVGLSKIPRIVDMYARRLQVQERMTNEIADALDTALDPVGVMVVVEGQHSCAALRGVEKHGINMVTTAKRGEFRTNPALRDEFYRLLGR